MSYLDVKLNYQAQQVSLRQLCGGLPTVLVFTRHMDCPFCQIYVHKLIKHQSQLGRVIILGNQEAQETVFENVPHEAMFASDPDDKLYQALSAPRFASYLKFRIKLKNAPVLIGHLLRGRPLKREGADLLRLGGTWILDADGKIIYSHLPKRPDDRPSVEEVIYHQQMACVNITANAA